MSQLTILPDCLPATVQRVLERMNPRYHITYGRIMQRIPNENWEHAHRIFQLLAVCIRPLIVDELSEVLTIDYDRGDDVTPKYEAIWHPETPDKDIFTVCRHTVKIDEVNGAQVVKFVHVSVAEWLYSKEILLVPESLDRVPRYQITTKESHYVAALTCIAPILHFNDKFEWPLNREKVKIFTMVEYASENLIYHIQQGENALYRDIDVGLRRLFDPQRPIFKAWLWLHDIDNPTRGRMVTDSPEDPPASTLYYAALCGFPRLVQHLAMLYYPEYRDVIVAEQEFEEEKVVARLLRKLPTPKKKREVREKLKKEKEAREAKEALDKAKKTAAEAAAAHARDTQGEEGVQAEAHAEERAAYGLVKEPTPEPEEVPAAPAADDSAAAPTINGTASAPTTDGSATAPTTDGSATTDDSDAAPTAEGEGATPAADGEAAAEGEDADPAAEGEDAPPAAPAPPPEEEEDIVPDPPDPFAFVPEDTSIPPVLEAALSTRCGGKLGSALHAAATGGHLQVVEVLLRVGSNPRERDRQNRTPEEVAKANGHFKVAELLSHHNGQC
jgi:hypothetical protein